MLATLYDAAVAGAAPEPLTIAAMHDLPVEQGQRVRIFALGKAAHAMARGALKALEGARGSIAGGIVVAPEPAPLPLGTLLMLEGDHPLPGARSFVAAERLAGQVELMEDDGLAVVLLSGGATSVVAAPLSGIDARDLVVLFRVLHRSGLGIHAMNVVRKRFTRWGAGRLAVALAPATVRVLVISDVPGDDVADVASGPCTPDSASARDVIAALRDAGLFPHLPLALRDHLDAARLGAVEETPKGDDPAFRAVTTRIIGCNRLAVDAALAHARRIGLHAEAGMPLTGEATRCGEVIADLLLARARGGAPACVVWGGEPTVSRRAGTDDGTGAGGRCQELALAAARRLSAGGVAAHRIALLAAGTDGRDGPTDAAGAFADAAVWDAIARAGADGADALERHTSYGALDAAGALFRCGLTGTNVMDVVIGLVT